jgi:hypothetical protein
MGRNRRNVRRTQLGVAAAVSPHHPSLRTSTPLVRTRVPPSGRTPTGPELDIHQQQPESQQLLPVVALALVRTQGSGWPHTAVKQDCRKVAHTSLVTIRPPASSCWQRETLHAAQPRFDGLARTTHATRGKRGHLDANFDHLAVSQPPRMPPLQLLEERRVAEHHDVGLGPGQHPPACTPRPHPASAQGSSTAVSRADIQ